MLLNQNKKMKMLLILKPLQKKKLIRRKSIRSKKQVDAFDFNAMQEESDFKKAVQASLQKPPTKKDFAKKKIKIDDEKKEGVPDVAVEKSLRRSSRKKNPAQQFSFESLYDRDLKKAKKASMVTEETKIQLVSELKKYKELVSKKKKYKELVSKKKIVEQEESKQEQESDDEDKTMGRGSRKKKAVSKFSFPTQEERDLQKALQASLKTANKNFPCEEKDEDNSPDSPINFDEDSEEEDSDTSAINFVEHKNEKKRKGTEDPRGKAKKKRKL